MYLSHDDEYITKHWVLLTFCNAAAAAYWTLRLSIVTSSLTDPAVTIIDII